MNNALMKRFEHTTGDQLRVLDIDDSPWFVATDVATILGYREAYHMTRSLDDDEKGPHQTGTLGGTQTITVISEAGLYKAILQRQTGRMLDGPAKDEVKKFQRWVTHEVLPQIRRTGAYAMEPVRNPADYSRMEILQLAMDAERENQVLQAALESAAPAIEYHDRFVVEDDVETVKSWAAQFGLSDRQARQLLADRHYIYKLNVGARWSEKKGQPVLENEWRPYAKHIEFFDLRPQHNAPRFHNGQVRQTLYIRQGKALALGKRLGLAAIPVQGDLIEGELA